MTKTLGHCWHSVPKYVSNFFILVDIHAVRFAVFISDVNSWIRNDVQVKLKKKYNDSYKSSKNLLSGSEWYCHQAFRALNQAAGMILLYLLKIICCN